MLSVFLVIGATLTLAASVPTMSKDTAPDIWYAIEDVNIGDLRTKVFKNTWTGEYVQIVTDLGGRIEDLVLLGQYNARLRSVLLTHHNNATAIKENAWWRNAILLPYANRINEVSSSMAQHFSFHSYRGKAGHIVKHFSYKVLKVGHYIFHVM